MRSTLKILLALTLFIFACEKPTHWLVESPYSRIVTQVSIAEGQLFYQVERAGQSVIAKSRLGNLLNHDIDLSNNLQFVGRERNLVEEVWEQPWGEQRLINNYYNELDLELTTTGDNPVRFNVVFRNFNDGVALRYEFPEQANLQYFEITDELTEFTFAGDHSAWWIPAYHWNRYEYLYSNTPLTAIDTVHTPLTLETSDGLYLALHEAALTDYASMTLLPTDSLTLECDLVPWGDGVKVKASTPHVSPWRMIMIGETPGDLITNYMELNLNEPAKIADVSWIRPGKYIGIWWGMHIDTYSWSIGPRHGATNENVRRYIDFAADNGFNGVLVEGWNPGWEGPWFENGNIFKYTEAYPDFDLPALSAYAARRGVQLIGHHETSASIDNYESQVEEAFGLYRKNGIKMVKTGYVGHGQNIERMENGQLAPNKEWHHGQYMVRHYRKITELAAKYGIMLDVHEPIKDTGLRRTWPNLMTREGARGQEFNGWAEDCGNPPDYTTIIPFTRCLSGPFDFTPGIFDLYFKDANRPDNRVNTTLMKQLALYVTIYSPLQMAADLPENYAGHPAFQFIRDVPVDWEKTIVLNGKIGDYVTTARRDRNSRDWYIGSITDEQARDLNLKLDFLEPGVTYRAQIYADGPDADWRSKPYSYTITESEVDSNTELNIRLAPGGGQAIRLFISGK